MFSSIKNVDITGGYENEMIGLRACMAASGIGQPPTQYESEIDMILEADKKCSDIITTIVKYIDENFLSSSSKSLPTSSSEIGRELMSMVESIGPLFKDEGTFNRNLNDFLMVIYLSNLCKTQLMLNEKLALV